MQEPKAQNFIKSTAILAAASILVRIIGAIYKIPLFSILDKAGAGAFQVTYSVYTLALNIATAGVPVALSRMISSAAALGNDNLVNRYFKVALPFLICIGVAAMLAMLFYAEPFASAMNNSLAAPGIQVLAPAVLFVCIISVYRGYAQGFENMIPTAVSQTLEAVCKAVFGIAIAYFLARAGYSVQYVSAGGILGVTIGLGLCLPILARYKRNIDKNLIINTETSGLPGFPQVLWQLLMVSIPITIGSSFFALVTVIDNSVVQGRLQYALGLSEFDSSAHFGLLAYGLTLYNLPSSLIVPVAISLVPAIAAAIARKQLVEARKISQTSIKLMNLFALPACAGIMVLAAPIMFALFEERDPLAGRIMVFLSIAAFFVCFQLVTTAILQANGYERLPLLSIPVGGAVKIALSYLLVGNPEIGIVGSALSSLACYIVVCALNVVFIKIKVADPPRLRESFMKPLLCTAIMTVFAHFVYVLIHRFGAALLGIGRFATTVYLALTIILAVIVYLLLVVYTGAITKDDLMLVPKSEKLAKYLRIL